MEPEHDERYPGMVRTDATLSLAMTSVVSLPLTLAILAVFLVPYVLIWGAPTISGAAGAALQVWGFVLLFILGIVAHEGLHAVGWAVFGRIPWRHIEFGIKSLTPYTHCSVPISVMAYRLGAALPGFALGVMPAGIGLLLGSGWLVLWGAVFAAAASGDFIILWLIRRTPNEALVLDHPDRAGCVILTPIEPQE